MGMETSSIFDYIHYLYTIGLTLFFLVIFIRLRTVIRKF